MVQEIPLEALVLETDSPYLAPVPHRGKRNNSQNLVYVAEEIAALKGVSYEEVVRQTTENAKNCIDWKSRERGVQMKEPTLGNPQNTIAVLQKYNFVFQKNSDRIS